MADAKIIRTILGAGTSNKSVVGQAILEALKTTEDPAEKAELLAVALTERDSVSIHTGALSNRGITTEKWETLHRTHRDFVNSFLKFAFFNTKNVQEFAGEIVKMLELLLEDDARAFALGIILYSDFIPYGQLDLPQELESELATEATQLGLSLTEYVLRLLSERSLVGQLPTTGAELAAYWQREGVIGTRLDITDSQAHARQIRHKAERRLRE